MIKITLEDINRKSPYEITLNNGDFDFTTDSGTRYSVSFLEDVPLGGCDTYQFGFRKREDTHSGYDARVKDALIAIIEQFFADNANVLLIFATPVMDVKRSATDCSLDGLKSLQPLIASR